MLFIGCNIRQFHSYLVKIKKVRYPYFFSISFITLFFLNSHAQQPRTEFGPNEILEDVAYLYNSLKDAHYDLYAYTSEEEFARNYHRIKNAITSDSIDILEATNIFQKVISAVKNGHTEIDFPVASYRAYAYNGGTLFPLEIAFENNKNLIRKNFSDNQSIQIGSEIVRINGRAMEDILVEIYPHISAERKYLKNAKIELYSFPRLYWQVFGRQDDFQVEIKDQGVIKTYSIKAVNLIDGYETKRTEILNSIRELNFFDSIAYVNPGPFSGDEIEYQKFIDAAFIKTKEQKCKVLILDLRNNGGGNDSYSDYLVSYIADTPFQWNSRLSIKTSEFLKDHTRKYNDTTDSYFKNILEHKNGEVYDVNFENYQPKDASKRFNGMVYVLVNRQSHSQSAVTAAQIQDYKFGTIVGEETGDYPTLFASQFQYSLPNTGIVVKVSKGQIVRVNGSEKQEGVIPDIVIKDHLLDEEDEILNGLLQRIN